MIDLADDPQGKETPEQQLARIRAQSETPEQQLARIRGKPTGDQRAHRDYASGALQRRNTILNANDVGRAKDAAENDTYLDRLGSLAERHATELGGGKLLQAERAAITKEPWDTAGQNVANDITEAGQNEPGVTIPKAVPLVGGSRVTLPDLLVGGVGARAMLRGGAGPVAAGATTAGVPRLMSPAPESPFERAVGTVKATALGVAVPLAAKGIQFGKTALDASNALPLDENLVARGGARGVAASPLYDDFRTGNDLPMTPALDRLLKLPLVRRALRMVQGESSDLNGLNPTNTDVLDAVYKRVGNKAWTAQQGFEAGTTSDALKSAIDEAAAKAGQPLYSPGVDTFAEHSGLMDAVGKGNRAMQYAASPKGTPLGAIEDSPAAFREWSSQPERTPAELSASREGINARLQVEPKTARVSLGAVKLPIPIGPSRAMGEAPGLLEAAGQGASPLDRALRTVTADNSINVRTMPSAVKDWWSARNAPDMAETGPSARAATAQPSALPEGYYDMGTGAPTALGRAQEMLKLPRSLSAVPTEGELHGPAIPTRGVPPTDAEMFGDRIPPSRRLTRGPLVTPKPLPASASELAQDLSDAELRRRLGLSP